MLVKAGAPAGGTIHVADVTIDVLDHYDDVALARSYEMYRTTGLDIADFDEMREKTNYDQLAEAGIVGEISAEEWNAGARPLKSIDRNLHLLNGAAWQLGQRNDILEARLVEQQTLVTALMLRLESTELAMAVLRRNQIALQRNGSQHASTTIH